MRLKRYSVLLRYPDYAACDWPNDIYMITVSAHSYDSAMGMAQHMASWRINDKDAGTINEPEDLGVVCVVEGDHKFYIPM
jgi:hypothetical protein